MGKSGNETSMSIHDTIERRDMTSFQVSAILICLSINMLDGFDVLAIAFTAPAISSDWSLAAGDLGIALSAGLVGMTLGSLFLAPLGDRWGRRPVILGCLIIMSLGMIATGFSRGVPDLSLYRVITGLGIGGMLASLNTIVAEYSSSHRRDLAVSLLQAGYPIGATIGGIAATFFILNLGWRSVFIGGGILSLLMVPLVAWRVPESLDFLLSKRPKGSLNRINHLLGKLNVPLLNELPPLPAQADLPRTSVQQILGNQIRPTTLALWASFFLVMFSFYFVLSWTPKLLVDSGLSQAVGISGGVIINVGGIVGIFLLGIGTARFGAKRLISIYMIATSVAMVVFGFIGTNLVLLSLTAVVIGFFLFGSIVGLYVITPRLYSAAVRTTGTGWAIGIGRLGAVLGPYLAGLMREEAWSVTVVFVFFSIPMLIACYTLSYLRIEGGGSSE